TAWKWELIGGMLLIFLSLYYSVLSYKHLSWILGIGLPVLVIGILFLVSHSLKGKKDTSSILE
ncbi:MAG: hypothetical protein Q8862_11735, partial [Bacteroidota bacterium]|nr:hypothetical protein [Bacteroidota bacterium]